MALARGNGRHARRLAVYLRRRLRTPGPARRASTRPASPELFRRRAVVFTDTADFTALTLRHGILHFLMAFDRVREGAAGWSADDGAIVKVEADSLLLRFPDVPSACRFVPRWSASSAR